MSELNQAGLNADKLVSLGQKQTAVKFKAFCKEDNVESVLVQELSPVVNTFQAADGKVSYSGKITAKLLVEEQNGGVGGMSYTADFSDEFFAAAITENSAVLPRCDILDFSTEVDGAEVSVNAVIATDFLAVNQVNYPLFDGDGVICKRNKIPVGTVTARVDEVFSAGAELEVKADVARVLSSQSFAVIDSAEVKDKVLTVTGECVLNLSYLTTESQVPQNAYFTYEFTQEIAVEADGMPFVFADVRATKIHMEIEENAQESVFMAESLIVLRGIIVEETEREVVVDCFSPTNATNVAASTAESTVIKHMCALNSAVEEKIVTAIPSNAILSGFFGGNVSVVNAMTVEGGVDVSGVVSGNVIYTVDDTVKSEKIDLPFNTVLTCDAANVGDGVYVNASIRVADVTLDGGEATVKAELVFSVRLTSTRSSAFVSSVDIGEAENADRGAIEVCLAFKGDNLWEVAKSLKMSVEDILQLNPELTDPLDRDQKLLIYHTLQA